MDAKKEKHETDEVQQFLKDNFHILTLIGVFAAVAKYFIIDEPNRTTPFTGLSVAATLMVIFLLFIFLVSSTRQIIRKTQDKIDQNFIEFVQSSFSDILIMIIVILVALITVFLIRALMLQYPEQLPIVIFLIEVIIGLIFSAILAVYILIHVRTLLTSFIAMILVAFFLFFSVINIGHVSHFDLLSLTAQFMVFFIIGMVLFPITFLKFSYYAFFFILELLKTMIDFLMTLIGFLKKVIGLFWRF